MIFADWIALAIVVVFALIGLFAGFGKGLKFFTSGIFGVLISIFVCYCIGGLFLDIEFVQDLLAKFADLWTGKDGFFFDLLTQIHAEIIVYYIALFIVVQIVRVIVVAILKNIAEIKFLPISILNRLLGMALFVGAMLLIALFVFQIIMWVDGSTVEHVREAFDGSLFRLDWLFENNPLNSIIEQVQKAVETIKPN